jgi:hypothetical protein
MDTAGYFKVHRYDEVWYGNSNNVISVVSISVKFPPQIVEPLLDWVDITVLEQYLAATRIEKLILVQPNTGFRSYEIWGGLPDHLWNRFCALVERYGRNTIHSLELPQTAFLVSGQKDTLFFKEERMVDLISRLHPDRVHKLWLHSIKQDCSEVLPRIAQYFPNLKDLRILGWERQAPGILGRILWNKTKLPAAFADRLSATIDKLHHLQQFHFRNFDVEEPQQSWNKILRAICPKPGLVTVEFGDDLNLNFWEETLPTMLDGSTAPLVIMDQPYSSKVCLMCWV